MHLAEVSGAVSILAISLVFLFVILAVKYQPSRVPVVWSASKPPATCEPFLP